MSKFKLKRGFSPLHAFMSSKGKYVASCSSCKYFFKVPKELEEYCHNPNVTEFDMQRVGERVFCTFWNILDERGK